MSGHRIGVNYWNQIAVAMINLRVQVDNPIIIKWISTAIRKVLWKVYVQLLKKSQRNSKIAQSRCRKSWKRPIMIQKNINLIIWKKRRSLPNPMGINKYSATLKWASRVMIDKIKIQTINIVMEASRILIILWIKYNLWTSTKYHHKDLVYTVASRAWKA